MSEFKPLTPPNPGELPKPNELVRMLQAHAYEAGKLFAEQGSVVTDTEALTMVVNYGSVGDKQIQVSLQEGHPQAGVEDYDGYRIAVRVRPRHQELADNEGWRGSGVGYDSYILIDPSRPDKSPFAATDKQSVAARPRPEGELGVSYEPLAPEELAYTDSLLTQLALQQ